MKTDSGKKRDNKHNGQIRPVLCLLALALLASAILLTGLNLTGKDRELSMHPTPEPTAEFIRDNTPIPIPPTEAAEPTFTPELTPEPYVPTAIFVDGNDVCTLASRQAAENLLLDVIEHFESMLNAPGIHSEIEGGVELVPVTEAVKFMSYDNAYALLTGDDTPLRVVSRNLVYETESLSHGTSILQSDDYYIGTRFVASYGIDGKNRRSIEYTYVNGLLTGSEILEIRTLYSSVMENIIVGTRPVPDSDTNFGDFGRSDCEYYDAAFRYPVDPRSCTLKKYFGFFNGVMHPGIDYECPMNTPCKSVLAGKVISVMERGAYGLTVDIEHNNGLISRYSGLASVTVEVGDTLSISEQIGVTGESLFHFELILNGRPRNPRIYPFKLWNT